MSGTGTGTGPVSPLVCHASAVVLGDGPSALGVLIEGPSGSGKSALALQLIALGASLVADDRTRIALKDGRPWLFAPERLAGVIEARGIGLLRVPAVEAAPLGLIVDMGASPPATPPATPPASPQAATSATTPAPAVVPTSAAARLPEPKERDVLGERIRYLPRVDGPHFAGSIVALSKGGWWHDG